MCVHPHPGMSTVMTAMYLIQHILSGWRCFACVIHPHQQTSKIATGVEVLLMASYTLTLMPLQLSCPHTMHMDHLY